MKVGITERGDAGLDLSWLDKVKDGKVDGCIAITKAPSKLVDLDIPDNIVIHCTITGLGGSIYEPNVKEPSETIEAYLSLVQKYGGERVVLRIDPIIMGAAIHPTAVAEHTKGRVRISFLDMYSHVLSRLEKANAHIPHETFHAPIEARYEIVESLTETLGFPPEICGEPGFPCTGCVSERDLLAMGIMEKGTPGGRQRSTCCCLAEKVELLKNKHPCKHNCLYCYWKS